MTVENTIITILNEELSPIHLEVRNESYMHNVPAGSESHFKVTIATEKFDGLRLIARHRVVNGLLSELLANQIHALTMHTYTPEQWKKMNADLVPNSPNCMGQK